MERLQGGLTYLGCIPGAGRRLLPSPKFADRFGGTLPRVKLTVQISKLKIREGALPPLRIHLHGPVISYSGNFLMLWFLEGLGCLALSHSE